MSKEIRELRPSEQVEIADRLEKELSAKDREQLLEPRLQAILSLAEDTHFSQEQNERISPKLLEFAVLARNKEKFPAQTVYLAIRLGASMLRPQEASRLIPLLELGYPIETCLVTLKMLGRIFEAQPPENLDQHTDLADEVRRMAELMLNPIDIEIANIAAMAQLSVLALAAMGSSEVLNVIQTVRQMNVLWFTVQVVRELRELLNSWEPKQVDPAVFGLVDRVIYQLADDEFKQ